MVFISLKHDTVPRVNNLYAPQKYSQFPWRKNILPINLTLPDLCPHLWPDLTWPVTWPATCPVAFVLDPPDWFRAHINSEADHIWLSQQPQSPFPALWIFHQDLSTCMHLKSSVPIVIFNASLVPIISSLLSHHTGFFLVAWAHPSHGQKEFGTIGLLQLTIMWY